MDVSRSDLFKLLVPILDEDEKLLHDTLQRCAANGMAPVRPEGWSAKKTDKVSNDISLKVQYVLGEIEKYGLDIEIEAKEVQNA